MNTEEDHDGSSCNFDHTPLKQQIKEDSDRIEFDRAFVKNFLERHKTDREKSTSRLFSFFSTSRLDEKKPTCFKEIYTLAKEKPSSRSAKILNAMMSEFLLSYYIFLFQQWALASKLILMQSCKKSRPSP